MLLTPLLLTLALSRPPTLSRQPTARPVGVTPSPPPHDILHLHASLEDASGKASVQRDACAAIVNAFRGSSVGGSGTSGGSGADAAAPAATEPATRVTAVLPSGAGKTVLALRVVEAMRSALTIVLVPSIELVSQSYRDYDRWRAAPGVLDGWRPLAVCSSSSVPASELPRTTDVNTIAAFLRNRDGAPAVVFCTYHSAKRVSEALAGRACDLLICDEAHRCTGRRSKRDAKPLSDAFLTARRRLFLTATPRLIGSSRDAEGALIAAGSMDDEALFGRVAYRLGYGAAVRKGVVSPLRLVFLDVSEAYRRWEGRVALDDVDDDGGGGTLVLERRLSVP